MTTCQPDNAVRAGESQKSQDSQHSDKQKCNHEDLPSPRFNPPRCWHSSLHCANGNSNDLGNLFTRSLAKFMHLDCFSPSWR